jgi:serine O-acetyltransferase
MASADVAAECGHVSLINNIALKFIQIMTSKELSVEAQMGRAFVIDHHCAIVASRHREVEGCCIHNVRILKLRGVSESVNPLTADVDIGAGAKLLEPITIGNRVVAAANVVLSREAIDNSIAAKLIAITRQRRN